MAQATFFQDGCKGLKNVRATKHTLDVSAIEQPDADVQNVNLDQQQNEDEAIEKQAEEIQRDEQKHDDSSTDLTTETLLDPQQWNWHNKFAWGHWCV